MDKKRQIKISKFLSYVLRHNPDIIGIQLDLGGWADVSSLLHAAEQKGFRITEGELKTVVKQSDKRRFSFSKNYLLIRADYGHSIPVELGYNPEVPPDILYHGTAEKNLKEIRSNGINKGNRQYVHLSMDIETATRVGQRHGKPIILGVLSGRMHSDGCKFYHSTRKIWLTDRVLPEYLRFPENKNQCSG
jgi:putative RNA 2'-phosphotransferase